jgi:hypothetical protein
MTGPELSLGIFAVFGAAMLLSPKSQPWARMTGAVVLVLVLAVIVGFVALSHITALTGN